MFEAYQISCVLLLEDLISPKLLRLAKEFEKLEGITATLKESIGKIGLESEGFRKLSTAANSTNRALEKASVSAAAFHRQMSAIHALGPGLPQPPGVPTPGGGGRRTPGGMHGGNLHVGAGGIGLGTVGMATGDLFWPLAAAGATGYAGKSLFDSAKALDTEQQRFRLYGLSEAQNADAFKFVQGMHIYGSTQTSNMGAFREAQGVFRESGLNDMDALRGAKLAAPVLAKLDFLSSSLDEESAARMHTSNMNMLRYVESSGGLQSAEEFNRIVNFGYKMNASSGDTVDWAQLRQLKARAGAAGMHLTDDALARLEPAIGELKGGAVGFGLSTGFNRLTGAIRIPNQVAHQLVKQGIWDASKVIFNKNGGIKNFTGNPLGGVNTELLQTNPEKFYEDVIRPIYAKMKLSATDISRENVMMFGTTGGRLMSQVENQLATIHRSVDALNRTKGIDDAVTVGKQSLTGQQKEFEAAWNDFKTQWGTTMLPFFTRILKVGSTLLRPADSNTSWYTNVGKGMLNPLGSLYDVFAGNTLPNAVPDATNGSKGMIHTTINIDGRKVATAVTPHMGKAMSGSQTGLSSYDPSMTPWNAGIVLGTP